MQEHPTQPETPEEAESGADTASAGVGRGPGRSFVAIAGVDIPEEFLAAVGRAKRLVLMTHRGPDGDGLGSQLALAEALGAAGREVAIINADPPPPRFRFLDPAGLLQVYRRQVAAAIRAADLALLVDTSEVSRAGPPAELRRRAGGPFLAIDHHPPAEQSLEGLLVPERASTAEIVCALLDALDLPMSPRVATALYAGISYDTLSFRFVRGDPAPHAAAAELIARGANAERVQARLFRQPRDFLRLLGRLLGEITYHAGGRVAMLGLTYAHAKGLDLDPDDVHDVVNVLNGIQGVDACAFVRQTGRRDWRVNLRSAEGVEIDGIARAMGGGGHPRASGATRRGVPLDAVMRELEERLGALFPQAADEAPAQE